MFSKRTLGSIAVVLAGVFTTIAVDVTTLSLRGCITAALSVFFSSAQQIGVAKLQKQYLLSANELVATVFHWQALVLLVGGPMVDFYLFGSSPLGWEGFLPSDRRLLLLFGSCMAAVAVNYSQVLCVRFLSPTGFQVLGNAKTTCVLLIGWAFFDGAVPFRTLIGQAAAILGMVLYGRSTTRPVSPNGSRGNPNSEPKSTN